MNLRYIKGLINEEYADYSLYHNEADLFKNKIVGGEKIAEIFINFSFDEIRHIEKLRKIFDIADKPLRRKIPMIRSLRETLRRHLERESIALKEYRALKTLLNDENKVKMIDEIIADEEKHYSTIKKYLLFLG